MNANNLDRADSGPGNGGSFETPATAVKEADLFVEELEEVIAPKIAINHNEAMVFDEETNLEVEELEDVIAPKIAINHNQTMVADPE
jgi:hypothetical protein